RALLGGRGMTWLAPRGLLLRAGPRVDAARSAVVADVVDGGVVDHRLTVDVTDVGIADVIDGTVVIELVVAPVATFIAMSEVAEAVDDTAVETDLRAPVAGVPDIGVIGEAPVARRPYQIRIGGQYPGAGHPEVALGAVTPISRYPD